MRIYNNENYITNKQIKKIVSILGAEYKPNNIVICENRKDILGYILKFPSIIFHIVSILLGRLEGFYNIYFGTIFVFVFSENDDGNNKHSKQFYSLHAMLHELRHCYQRKNNIHKNIEADADNFATTFLNNNSMKISQIMHWKDEWTIEEEN